MGRRAWSFAIDYRGFPMTKAILSTAAAALALAAATPASALTIVNNGANSSVTVTGADLLTDFIIFTDGSTENSDGLFGKITMELAAFTTNSFTFNYRIENTSVNPAANSRLGQFGFDVAPGAPANNTNNGNFTVADGASDHFQLASSGNFNGLGNREICLTVGNNCSGGGNDGILSGFSNSKVGQLIFTYAGTQQSITFSRFVTRWQAGQNDASASGGSTSIVPEPATWAMMIGGFGLVGGAMRRRRSAHRQVIA
jgi:hypothetical protein